MKEIASLWALFHFFNFKFEYLYHFKNPMPIQQMLNLIKIYEKTIYSKQLLLSRINCVSTNFIILKILKSNLT